MILSYLSLVIFNIGDFFLILFTFFIFTMSFVYYKEIKQNLFKKNDIKSLKIVKNFLLVVFIILLSVNIKIQQEYLKKDLSEFETIPLGYQSTDDVLELINTFDKTLYGIKKDLSNQEIRNQKNKLFTYHELENLYEKDRYLSFNRKIKINRHIVLYMPRSLKGIDLLLEKIDSVIKDEKITFYELFAISYLSEEIFKKEKEEFSKINIRKSKVELLKRK